MGIIVNGLWTVQKYKKVGTSCMFLPKNMNYSVKSCVFETRLEDTYA